MDSRIAKLNRIAPRRIRAQAALWVTELHGPDRDASLESRVKQWIAEDPRHAAAFELATDAWQRSGNLPAHLPAGLSASNRLRVRRLSRPVLGGVAVVIAAVVMAIYLARDGTLTTGAGEQRTVALSDGTEVSLSANSRVAVEYDDRIRRVKLIRGEAMFNVVKHQPRPFVVCIGDRKVVAMGTSFLVRREDPSGSAFAVTLVEGRVAVESISGPDVLPTDLGKGFKLLSPGQRLRFADNERDAVDSPSIEKVTAWERGQLIFDDVSLQEAAEEFNRNASKTIVIDDAHIGEFRVGGVFRIGDPASFAHAMADAHHLRVIDRGATIVLARDPDNRDQDGRDQDDRR